MNTVLMKKAHVALLLSRRVIGPQGDSIPVGRSIHVKRFVIMRSHQT